MKRFLELDWTLVSFTVVALFFDFVFCFGVFLLAFFLKDSSVQAARHTIELNSLSCLFVCVFVPAGIMIFNLDVLEAIKENHGWKKRE
mgnify:FL=1